jgi:drug/metabolite transporter (DMT)-like permease
LKQLTENNPAYFYMLCGALAFALMGTVSHAAGEHVAWQGVALARAGIAFALSWATAWASGVRLVWFGPSALWVRSLAGSTGLFCSFYALTHLPVADALTLTNTSALWVTLISRLVLRERLATSVWLAMLLALAGVVCLQQPHFAGGKFACFIALLCGLWTALAMLGLNRLQNLDARAVVVHFSGVSSIATAIFFALTTAGRADLRLPDAWAWLLLCGVGVLGVLGQYGMTLAFARGHAPRVAVVTLAQVLFALVLDVTVGRREINALSLAGMALIVAPTAWLLVGGNSAPARED